MKVDWGGLARDLGVTDGEDDTCTSDTAKEAIANLLGEDAIRDAIDHYISSKPGSDLIKHVLWQLQPECARTYCRNLIRNIPVDSASQEGRQVAAELLRVIADKSVINWLPELLHDDDDMIAFWAVGVIDQLLFANLIRYEDAESFIFEAFKHHFPSVRKTASFCRARYSIDLPYEAFTDETKLQHGLKFNVLNQPETFIHGDQITVSFPDKTCTDFVILDVQKGPLEAECGYGMPCQLERLENNLYSFLIEDRLREILKNPDDRAYYQK